MSLTHQKQNENERQKAFTVIELHMCEKDDGKKGKLLKRFHFVFHHITYVTSTCLSSFLFKCSSREIRFSLAHINRRVFDVHLMGVMGEISSFYYLLAWHVHCSKIRMQIE